jgi:hypothetical protein
VGGPNHLTGQLTLPHRSSPVSYYFIPDSDLSHSLVGISPLLRPHGRAVFTPTSVHIFDSPSPPAPFLSGSKSPSFDLWTFTVPCSPLTLPLPSAPHSALFTLSGLPFARFVSYLHRSFAPRSISTFTRAIARRFIHEIPDLTAPLVRKFPPLSLSSLYGHLDLLRKGLSSTRPESPPQSSALWPVLLSPPALALASPPFSLTLLLPPTAVRGTAPPSPSPARIGLPRTSPVVSPSLPMEDTSIYSLSSTGIISTLSPCLPAVRC